jgi:tetratricopeptide (TPR) repeat protein
MRVKYFLAWLSLSVWLAGCATIRGEGDVDQGRQALFEGNYKAALGYFQAAEQADPNYIYGTELREGVLSYLGRAQYLNGNYAQARQTLEKALFQHKSGNVARLYLGLTLYRLGDQKSALTNIQAGMNGINNFLNYITETFQFSFGKDWDASGRIRSGIKSDLAMISSGNIDWKKLIADGESLGIRIEREPDLARQQEEDRPR